MSRQHRIISPSLISSLGVCLSGQPPGKHLKLFIYAINATWKNLLSRFLLTDCFLKWTQSSSPESWLSKPPNVLLPIQMNTTEQLPTWKTPNLWSVEISAVITGVFLIKHKYGSQRWHQNETLKCKLSSSNSKPLKLIFHSHFSNKTWDVGEERSQSKSSQNSAQ